MKSGLEWRGLKKPEQLARKGNPPFTATFAFPDTTGYQIYKFGKSISVDRR